MTSDVGHLLRCGRGDGLRHALVHGDSAEVLACVLDDPRWDRQIEDRDDYYARPLVAFDVDVRLIEDRIIEGTSERESDFWLPVGVLAEMTARGHQGASRSILACIRRGARWRSCLDALEAAGGESLIASLVTSSDIEALLHHAGVEEVIAARRFVAAPWDAWARDIEALRFSQATEGAPNALLSGPWKWIEPRMRPVEPAMEDSTQSTTELLDVVSTKTLGRFGRILDSRVDAASVWALRRAVREGTVDQQVVALGVFGRRGCADFLDDAVSFLESERDAPESGRRPIRLRRAFLRYLEGLPATATLDLARGWIGQPWPLRIAAEFVLGRHATVEDREVVEDAALAALRDDEMYRLCSMVDAMSVIGVPESIATLVRVYAEAPYSLARKFALAALVPHAQHRAVAPLFVEALWDCEASTRALACRESTTSDLTVARRTREMALDEHEDPEVRSAATAIRNPP